MADNGLEFIDQAVSPVTYKTRSKDLGAGVFKQLFGLTNTSDAEISPATEGTLSTLSTTATTISGKLPAALGQAVMANSLSVVVASNQSAVPISAASLPLPTGAAADATITTMSGKLPASLGQKAMAASMSVVLASDQSAFSVNLGTIAGVATEATLAAASAKLPSSLGQKAASASMSVVLPNDRTVVDSSITVANTAEAYASGDVIQGLKTITPFDASSGFSGTLDSITLVCSEAITAPVIVFVFEKTLTPAANNAAFAPSAAEMLTCVGVYQITLANPVSAGNMRYGSYDNIAKKIKNRDTSPGTSLYFVFMMGSGGYTFTGTSSLTAVVRIVKD